MYPLVLCSIVAIGIIFERFLALRRSRVVPPDFLPGLRGAFKEVGRDSAAAQGTAWWSERAPVLFPVIR